MEESSIRLKCLKLLRRGIIQNTKKIEEKTILAH